MVYGNQTARKVATMRNEVPMRYVLDNSCGSNSGKVCEISEITYSLMGPTVSFATTETDKP